MNCSKCGREVPVDAIYCPHCTGDRKTSDREIIRGGVKGALLGLALGLVPAIAAIVFWGVDRSTKGIAFAVPVAGLATGLIIGLVKAKREWK